MKERKRTFFQRWSFPILLGLGYLADGIVVFIFLLAGANSGWSFTGDGAGGIGLVYAATIFLPHMLLFFFSLVAITILAIILWRELGLRSRLLLAFYYLLTALILWSNLAPEGGIAVRYAARRLFAPGYYASATPDSLSADSALRRLLNRYDREASSFYAAGNGAERQKHYLALRFWRTCIERTLRSESSEEYRAFTRTSELTGRLFRSHVHSLADAALEERPSRMLWTRREKLEGILERLAEGRDEEHPDPCGEELDTEAIHRLVYRDSRTVEEAAEKWNFILRRSSRDLLLLDADRALVADSERGIELWRRTPKGWRYRRTLYGAEGAYRLLRRGELLYALLRRMNRGYFLVRFRFDPAAPSLGELSRIRPHNGGEMREWDADASGTRLFLANGYSGILLVDFRDPAHPEIHRATGLGSRNVRADDLLWDGKRQRLYAATSRGLQSCTLNREGALRCENFFPARPVRPERPRPPKSLLALVAPDSRFLLGIRRLREANATAFSLYDRNVTDGAMPAYLREIPIDLSLDSSNYHSATHPENARYNGREILLPTRNGLALIGTELRLRGCVDTGRIYRFVPLGEERILAAQGSEGIREWRLDPGPCRNPGTEHNGSAP